MIQLSEDLVPVEVTPTDREREGCEATAREAGNQKEKKDFGRGMMATSGVPQ